MKTGTINLDKLGMTASLTCAVHCMAMPLVITILPYVGLSFIASEGFEYTFTDSVTSILVDPENWILKNAQVQYDATLNNLNAIDGLDELLVYPNPANDFIHFVLPNVTGLQVKIYSILGTLCAEKTFNEAGYIDVSNLEEGLYVYELIAPQKMAVGKFIIKMR